MFTTSRSSIFFALVWSAVPLGTSSTGAWTITPTLRTTRCRSFTQLFSIERSQNDDGKISLDSHAPQPKQRDLSTAAITTSTSTSSRRAVLESSTVTALGALLVGCSSFAAPANAAGVPAIENGSQEVFKLPSGLKYIETKEGTGPTPIYGQLVSIAYKGYIKLPASKEDANPKPQIFGQSKAYLLKHGNGRTISGLDQGLHTMRVGGTRRLIIPAKLGYVRSGLGPLPPSPWDRYRLNNLLDDMVRLQGGNLVFEVTLLSAVDDEADQGYYNDASLTPEEFETLRSNLQQKGKATKNGTPQ
eukprot:scaffold768_cov166-Amphora_coffeaeformis.AAC.1